MHEAAAVTDEMRNPERDRDLRSDAPSSASRLDIVEAVRGISLFRSASALDLKNVAALVIERRYPKNSMIVEEGLTGDYMYIIREGRVKVTKASSDGREKIMDFFGAGDFFGEMSLLDDAPRSASVRTLAPTRLLALSRRDFRDLLRCSPDLALALIQELTRRLRETDDQATSASFDRVEDRCKSLFERIARPDITLEGRRATPALTHQQIADMIGTSRETVTRAVKDLKQSGWLEQQGKRYLIVQA